MMLMHSSVLHYVVSQSAYKSSFKNLKTANNLSFYDMKTWSCEFMLAVTLTCRLRGTSVISEVIRKNVPAASQRRESTNTSEL